MLIYCSTICYCSKYNDDLITFEIVYVGNLLTEAIMEIKKQPENYENDASTKLEMSEITVWENGKCIEALDGNGVHRYYQN